MSARFTLCLLLVLCVAARAWAEDVLRPAEAPVEVVARSRRKIAAVHAEDPTASGTSLDLTHRVTIPRSLGDVVRESPGAQVVSTGGIGAFASVSLRGAASEETLVLLGEIPLSTADGGTFDLSLFPADLFAKVNTFRGGAPVWLGSGAIGGVLQLVPHSGKQNRLSASLGAGSFGTYQLNGGVETAQQNGVTARAQLVVRGTRGNYPYSDDGGTRFDSSDDRTLRLKNADFTEASGVQDVSAPLWGGTVHLVALGLVRGGGLSGPAAQPTPKIRRESSRALTALSFSREGGREGAALHRKLQLLASGAYGADRFTDLYGQLGTSATADRDNRSYRAFVRAAGSLSFARWLDGTWVSSYALDVYAPHDRFAYPQPRKSDRHTAASALELAAKGSLGRARFELRPSARIEWSETTLHAPASFRDNYASQREVLVPTFRLGGVVEPISGLALSASASTGTRIPTVFELFGDGGLTLPNLGLTPVKSTTFDGGITLRGRVGAARGVVEQRGFWQERTHSIQMRRTAQFQVINENVAPLHQWGSESHLNGQLTDFFHLSGSFTWLHTETSLGKRIPFRPTFIAYVRPEGRVRLEGRWLSSAGVSSELWQRSYSFYDNANLAYTPACTKLSFSGAVGLFRDALRFSARMDDSLDARCTDVVGYPLPGRSLFFSLSYQEVDDDET